LFKLHTVGVKPPYIARVAYPRLLWKIPNDSNKIYLTFDDGPIPEVTEWVLNTLDYYNIKATFFCVGDNVRKYPEIFQELKRRGHATGNHTFNHLNSWTTKNHEYLRNVAKSNAIIQSNLFRPPHGKIRYLQTQQLSKKYKIVMWDVLSKDYDRKLSPDDCFENVLRNTEPGSIIVFHDSLKAQKNLMAALPRSIESLLGKGFSFDKIPDAI